MIPSLLTLIVGITLTAGVCNLIVRNGHAAAETAIREKIEQSHLALTERLGHFETLLRGGRALWLSRPDLTNRQWHQFMVGFADTNATNGIEAYGFAKAGTNASGNPIAQVELADSSAGARSFIGKNLWSLLGFGAAFAHSAKSGKIELIQNGPISNSRQTGLSTLIAPTFRISSGSKRELEGWVFLTVNLQKTLHTAWENQHDDLAISIAPSSATNWSIPLKHPLHSIDAAKPIEVVRTVSGLDGAYIVNYRIDPDKLPYSALSAEVVAMTMIAITLLAATYLGTLISARTAATAQADEVAKRLSVTEQYVMNLGRVLEQIENVVMVCDHKGRIEWMNPAGEQLIRASQSQSPTSNVFDFFQSSAVRLSDQLTKRNLPTHFELETTAGLHFLFSNITITDQNDQPRIVFVGVDMTIHKERERTLEVARLEAERHSELKSQFLANMSHELRTPLNGIIGMTQLLQRTRLSADQADCAEVIVSSGQSLLFLINDILDLSKIESGKMTLSQEEFDLWEVLEQTCGNLSAVAFGKGLNFEVYLDSSVDALVVSDPQRMRQIVMNVLGNAVKFTTDGSITFDATVRSDSERSYIAMTITDTGIGIPESKLATIFDSFTQVDSGISRKFGGTGLGLAITRKLVDLMGGTISVSSQIGRGTTFSISIPVEVHHSQAQVLLPDARLYVTYDRLNKRHEAQIAAHIAAMNAKANSNSREFVGSFAVLPNGNGDVEFRFRGAEDATMLRVPVRASKLYSVISKHLTRSDDPGDLAEYEYPQFRASVLVVDDNAVNLKVASRVLAKLGCSVATASGGLQAVTMVMDGAYDLVLMDVNMPECDGYAATKMIRQNQQQRRHRTHICGFTAMAAPSDRDDCMNAGMDGYLSKPLVIGELVAYLETLVGHSVAA